MKTHYEVLGVATSATAETIYRAYKKLALANHPDTIPMSSPNYPALTAKFAEISNAYGVLKDERRRVAYDAELKLTRKPCGTCHGEGVTYVQKSFTARVAKSCGACGGIGYVARI